MKNKKQAQKVLIKSVMFRIFTVLIFLFTALIYIFIVGLIYLQYTNNIIFIYTETVTHALIIFLIMLFILGWFFIYTIYIGMIKPIYETFNIISETVNTLNNQDFIDKKQISYLNKFIKNSLEQLTRSSLINKINISVSTEIYIKKLSELIKQNEYLINSKQELSKLVEQLEKQHKLLELEQAKTSSIIDSLPNGLLVTSRDGNIFLVNKELEKILGINSNNLLGKFIDNILPKSDIEIDNKLNSKLAKTNNHITIFNYQSIDKKKNITIEKTSNPIMLNNNIFGSVYILRDITQEQATERAQKEFVSLASHQLRTPITSIKWNAEIILSDNKIKNDIRIAAGDIYKESHRMEKLINSLLNLSRIDLGKIKFNTQKIYLDKYIDTIAQTLKQDISDKDLIFEKNVIFKDFIVNDPAYIDIIIGNILYNAIKYTNKNGHILISIEKYAKNILIKISDTGIGIPKEQQSQIFGRLFRAENAKNLQPDGNGLGLYVVKKLIELMGGSIWFESQVNKGTVFFIELPIVIK
jgi:PAS domain S-box-containing protein